MFKEDVHRLPESVIEDLDQFLLDEWIGVCRRNCVRTFETGKRKCHRSACPRCIESGPDLRVTFGRAESHNDIVGADNRFEPRPKKNGKIERREGTLANDNRMNELDGNVLRIRGIGPLPKREQAAAAKKAVGHLAARNSKPISFAREERL